MINQPWSLFGIIIHCLQNSLTMIDKPSSNIMIINKDKPYSLLSSPLIRTITYLFSSCLNNHYSSPDSLLSSPLTNHSEPHVLMEIRWFWDPFAGRQNLLEQSFSFTPSCRASSDPFLDGNKRWGSGGSSWVLPWGEPTVSCRDINMLLLNMLVWHRVVPPMQTMTINDEPMVTINWNQRVLISDSLVDHRVRKYCPFMYIHDIKLMEFPRGSVLYRGMGKGWWVVAKPLMDRGGSTRLELREMTKNTMENTMEWNC